MNSWTGTAAADDFHVTGLLALPLHSTYLSSTFVRMGSTDLSVLYFFNQTIASPALDGIVSVLTNVNYWYAIYALGALWLIYKKKWEGVRLVVAALVLVAITDSLGHYLLKPWVGRLRPCAELPGGGHVVSWIRLPAGMKWDPSFPSNHAMNNFAVAALFAVINTDKRWGKYLLSIALLIGLGRLYEGVHYPSDVVGGGLIGIVIGVAFGIVLHAVEEKIQGTAPKKEAKFELRPEEIGSVDLGAELPKQPETKRVWMK